MSKYDPTPKLGKTGYYTGADALDLRVKLSDVGKVVILKSAGAPSTKGSISYPKPAAGGGKR